MRERDIFIEALERGDPSERTALLDEACQADAELRGRVERLLAEHDRQESCILDSPPAEFQGVPSGSGNPPTVERMISEGPGTVIGTYKLLQQIGEGGMGVVFMAEQSQPIQRTVALKIIKPGMDTRQVIARFEAERQAVAMMDHPNIAKVLDAGTTDSGRPYFVMELVKGVPITKYCDEKHLPLRARLELFVQVCQAVQHAHQKGIIHRDIKPNNVLVAEYDNQAVPKVIDFGVAKATAQRLTERTMFTEFGQLLGTMEYMSPEQSKFNQLDIDTRSDIYSLGVLLYELLAGSTPFEGKRLYAAAHDEMLRIIREEEPPNPSTRLSSIDTLPSVAVNRNTEPARLSKDVQGELDWIVMKALEKDRNRRYETASGFAADIERHLHDEPVEAGPPSAIYRFRKFARRNRVGITTATLVALALVLGTIVSTWQAIRAETARSAEAQQRQIAEDQRKVAEAERSEAEKQRALAEANFQKARKAVDDYFTLVSESKLFEVPGLQPLRRDLLEAALRFYKDSATSRTNDPALLADIAVTQMRVSSIYFALGRVDDSLTALSQGLDSVDQLLREHPSASEAHLRLAGYWKGVRTAELTMAPPSDGPRAMQTLLHFEKTWTHLAERYPTEPAFQSDLAAAVALIGSAWESSDRFKDAATAFRRSCAILQKLIREHPTVTQYRAELVAGLLSLVRMILHTDEKGEALALIREATDLGEALVAEFPEIPAYRAGLSAGLGRLGTLSHEAHQPQEAEKHFRRAMELAESLVRAFPGEATFRYRWSAANDFLEKQAEANGNSARVEEVLRSRIHVQGMLAAYKYDDYRIRIELASTLRRLAQQLARDPERTLEAEQLERQAVAVLADTASAVDKTLDSDRPDNGVALFDRVATYYEIAQMQTGEERLKTIRRATARADSLVVEFAGDRSLIEQWARLHGSAAGRLWGSGRPDEAAEHYHAAVAILEKRARKFPAQSDDTRLFANMAIYLARIMAYGARTTDVQETCRLCLRATEILDGRLKEDPIRRAFLAVAVRAYAERLLKEPERRPEAEQMMTWSTPIVEQTIKDVALLDKLTADDTAPVNDRHHAGETQQCLAKFLAWTNRAAEAEEMWLRAIRSFEAIDERFMIPYALGDYRQYLTEQVEQLVKSGRAEEAVKLLHKVIDALDTLAAEHPTSAELYRAFQVDILFQLTAILVAGDHAQEALVTARKSFDISQALSRDFPDSRNYQQRMISALSVVVERLVAIGKQAEAEEVIRNIEVKLADQVATSQTNPDLQFNLGHSYLGLASSLGASNHPQKAELFNRRALDLFEKLTAEFSDNGEFRAGLSQCYFALIGILVAQDKQDVVEETIRQAIDSFHKLAAAHPAVPDYWRSRAVFQRQLAQLQASDKRAAEAEKSYLEAINSYEKIIADFPQYQDLWLVHSGLAQSLDATNQTEKADEARRKAVELAPNNAGALNSLAWRYATSKDVQSRNASLAVMLAKKGIELDPKYVQLPNTLGVAYYRAGNWQEAIEWLKKSMDLRDGGDSGDWFFLAMAHWQLDDKEAAGKWYEQAVEWAEKNQPNNEELRRFRTEAEELLEITGEKPTTKPPVEVK